MARDNCISCTKVVSKTSHALQCSRCAGWNHVGCESISEEDFLFMKARVKFGFRWYCRPCVSDQSRQEESVDMSQNILETVKSTMENMRGQIFGRMDDLEAKINSSTNSSPGQDSTSETFANILKETLKEKNKEEPHSRSTTVNSFGQIRTVLDQQVLIVRPKSGGSDSTKLTRATENIREVLKSVPVNKIRKTNAGSLVVRFPTPEAKSEANSLMSSCFEDNDDFVVSQPKKTLPKITLTAIPTSCPDEEIIESILRKNKNIETLVEKGLHLGLVFVKSKNQSEHKVAVLRVAPEIRAAINRTGGYVYVGLTRCKAYDRFWVTQCFHCQRFGHVADKCPSKTEDPVCAFCAGHHRSVECPDKSSPKCVNCSSRATSGTSCDHYALSPDCPAMTLQREIVIENTNFVCSKNP